MLTNRRIQILKAIVDEFIQTAEPVGSKPVQREADSDEVIKLIPLY